VKIIKLSDASQALTEYAAGRRNEVVVLTERNKPVAALVPLKAADRESLALSGHPEFLDLIERSRVQFRRGHTISLEKMKQKFPSKRSPNTRWSRRAAERRRRAAHR